MNFFYHILQSILYRKKALAKHNAEINESMNEQPIKNLQRKVRAASISAGQSPLSVSNAANYQENKHKEWVKPAFSSIVYKLPVSNLSFIKCIYIFD